MSPPSGGAAPWQDPPPAGLEVHILHVPDCPLVGRARADVEFALASIGATAVVEEIEGPYPSPTVLIGGVDVTGRPLGVGPACRLDLPTRAQIVSAVLSAHAEGAGAQTIVHAPMEGGSR